ncbi:MAG: YerC/YecD family TrpR-related protein [Clostridiales bacterium]|nr:YerC/YecD family TrpR-related protein [Clostridiales bacterium]
MKDSKKTENAELLYKAVLTLKNEEECAAFFKDLCTETELYAMAQRFVVAKMVAEGKKYDEIEEKTGASPATISRVKRYMTNYVQYEIFDRINKKD